MSQHSMSLYAEAKVHPPDREAVLMLTERSK